MVDCLLGGTKLMKTIVILALLSFLSLPVYGQGDSEKTAENLPATSQPPLVDKQDKEKLRQDALELAGDFKTIFKDFSFVGQKAILSFVDSISQWIQVNYEKISQEKREMLKNFVAEMKIKLAGLEELSAQKITEVLQDLKALLDKLEKDTEQEMPENETEKGKLI